MLLAYLFGAFIGFHILLDSFRFIMQTLHLSKIFSSIGANTCFWMKGCTSAERPVWTKMWNAAEQRLTTDGGVDRILARSSELQYPQVVVSRDMSRIAPAARKLLSKTDFVEDPGKDKSILTKALELIAKEGPSHSPDKADTESIYKIPRRVVLLGGLSGRFDRTLGTLNSMYAARGLRPLPEVYVIDGQNIVFILYEFETSIVLDRSLLTGNCGLFPFCQQTTTVSTKGFKWNLENSHMEFGGVVSASNELDDDVIWISNTAPLILTMELSEKAMAGI